MRHYPTQAWMWSRAEGAAGAPERTCGTGVLAIFQRIAAELNA